MWATYYIQQLREGKTISFRPRGNSMQPRIYSGELCTVQPIDDVTLAVGDVVLCVVSGKQYLHLITAINGDRYQISNNHGNINGMISISKIYGKLIKVEK